MGRSKKRQRAGHGGNWASNTRSSLDDSYDDESDDDDDYEQMEYRKTFMYPPLLKLHLSVLLLIFII